MLHKPLGIISVGLFTGQLPFLPQTMRNTIVGMMPTEGPTRHKTGHFGDLPSQPLGLILKN